MPNNRPLRKLLCAQRGECFFCKKPLSQNDASVEHLVARSKGGPNHDENCVVCCKSLNTFLGNKPLKEKIRIFLNQKGSFECPNGNHTTAKKSKPQPLPYYAQVVANLKQRRSAKPATVTTLKRTIASLFSNKLSTDQVDALVAQLQSRRVLTINGNKINYARVSTARDRC